jgi:transposase
VLTFGGGVQIVLATEPVDLRRGHDGLITLVRTLWGANPYDGTLFVFLGRRKDRAKILFFTTGGFVIYYKRLEKSRFTLPPTPEGTTQIALDATSLAMLLDGVDLRAVRRAPMWRPRVKENDDRGSTVGAARDQSY